MKIERLVARKDYPVEGIKAGDTYYRWQLYRQNVCRSKTPPLPSQLDSSKWAGIRIAEETLNANLGETAEDMASALESAAECVREVADEYAEAADAFPVHQDVADAAEELASSLEDLVERARALADAEEEDSEEEPEESREEILADIAALSWERP